MQNMVFIGETPITGGKITPIVIGRDSFYTKFQLRLVGDIAYTYTGTPVSRVDGILGLLVSRIRLVANGKRTIKDVMPWLIKMQNYLQDGVLARRGSTAGASAVGNVTNTSNFTFGTSGQTTTVIDVLDINMCHPLVPKAEQLVTMLNANGLSSLNMFFDALPLDTLKSQANTAAIVWGTNNLKLELWAVKDVTYSSADRPKLYDYQQTTNSFAFDSATRDNQLLQLQNTTLSILFYALNGQGGSGTTATDRLPSDTVIKNLTLKRNGQFDDFNTSWGTAQDEMLDRYSANVPFVGGTRIIDGINELSYMKESLFEGLDTTNPKTVASLYLYAESNPAPLADYTNTAQLFFMQDALVSVPASDNANG